MGLGESRGDELAGHMLGQQPWAGIGDVSDLDAGETGAGGEPHIEVPVPARVTMGKYFSVGSRPVKSIPECLSALTVRQGSHRPPRHRPRYLLRFCQLSALV